MKEHPDYKYRPRRKPKPLMKKELGRYPFPFPFVSGPGGLDPMNPITRHLLAGGYHPFSPDKLREFHPLPPHLARPPPPVTPPGQTGSGYHQTRIKEEPDPDPGSSSRECSPSARPAQRSSFTRSPGEDERSRSPGPGCLSSPRRSHSQSPPRSRGRVYSPAPVSVSPDFSPTKPRFLSAVQDSPSHPDSTTSPAPLMVRPPSPSPSSLPAPSFPLSLSTMTKPSLSPSLSTYPGLTGLSGRAPLPLPDLLHYPPGLYTHLLHPYLPPHLVPSYLHALITPPGPALDQVPPPHIARPIPKLPTTIKTEAAEFHFRPPTAQHSNF